MRARALLALCLAACGATGGAPPDPPRVASGLGPFVPLAADPAYAFDAPFVLVDPAADLDDAALLAGAAGDLALWVTRSREGERVIAHADAAALGAGFGPLETALRADAPWEGGAVEGPAVVPPPTPGQPWLLFYLAGGAIGWARSVDGHAWQKGPGPLLRGEGDEGPSLGPPAAARVGDRILLVYPAGGRLWAAALDPGPLAAGAPGLVVRLDGDPATAARDPWLLPPPWARALERPGLRAERTAAGRLRLDLYFTALLPSDGGDAATVGGASAYEDAAGGPPRPPAALPVPLLPASPAARGPSAVGYEGGALLVTSQRFGARRAIAAARAP